MVQFLKEVGGVQKMFPLSLSQKRAWRQLG
jgi:hypothetical protein